MTLPWNELIVVMVIIIIILYVQLATTMTVETFGKMANPMRTLTFFNNMADSGVGEEDHPLFPFAKFHHMTIRAGRRARGSKNKFSMRIVQLPYCDRRQDALMFHMTRQTGLGLLNNVGMEAGDIRLRSRSKFLAGMTGQAFLRSRALKGFMT